MINFFISNLSFQCFSIYDVHQNLTKVSIIYLFYFFEDGLKPEDIKKIQPENFEFVSAEAIQSFSNEQLQVISFLFFNFQKI